MRGALKAIVIVGMILMVIALWRSQALQYALILGITAMKIHHLFISRERSETGKEA